ncbi:hypothetical protein [Acrocarpospora sp. B8E8]|uniref:hypothetical protein n=1 Tax=Acrocarpospora sp. B8E8 TaxID=3153572 RepID=UPI00325F399E
MTCRDCRALRGHRIGCWRLCPTCLKGTLTEMSRSISQPEQRRYSCGCRWTDPTALVIFDELLTAHERKYADQVTHARRIVREHLQAHPLKL